MDNSDIIQKIGPVKYKGAIDQGFSDAEIRQAMGGGATTAPNASTTTSDPNNLWDQVGNVPLAGGLINTATGAGRALESGVAAGTNAVMERITGKKSNPNALFSPKSFLTSEQAKGYGENPLAQGAKDLAGSASFAVPVAGGSIGAIAAKSALASGLATASQPGATAQDVAGGTLTGGVLGPVASKVLPGIFSSANKLVKPALEKAGEVFDYSRDQATQHLTHLYEAVPEGIRKGTDWVNTIGKMAHNYGLTDIDQINQFSHDVTGKVGGTGILTDAVEKSLDQVGPINPGPMVNEAGKQLPFLNQAVQDLKGSGIALPPNVSRTLDNIMGILSRGEKATVTNPEAALSTGTRGAVTTIDPKLVQSAVKDLETVHEHYAPPHNAMDTRSPESKQAYEEISTLLDNLKTRLYQGNVPPDVIDGAVAALRDKAKTTGVEAYNIVADKTAKATTIPELRNLQQDFVKASQLTDSAKRSGATPTAKGMSAGLGRVVGGGAGALLGSPLGGAGAAMGMYGGGQAGARLLAPMVEPAAAKLENASAQWLAKRALPKIVSGTTAATETAPSLTSKVVGSTARAATIPAAGEAAGGMAGSMLPNIAPNAAIANDNPNNNVDQKAQTAEKDLNDWYAKVSAKVVGNPIFQEAIDRQYQARKANIDQTRLISSVDQVEQLLGTSGTTSVLSKGPLDQIRQVKDPKYSALLRALTTINKLSPVPIQLSGDMDPTEIRNQINNLRQQLSGATSNQLPAITGGNR